MKHRLQWMMGACACMVVAGLGAGCAGDDHGGNGTGSGGNGAGEDSAELVRARRTPADAGTSTKPATKPPTTTPPPATTPPGSTPTPGTPSSSGHPARAYAVTEIPTLGGDLGEGNGINASGTVVGLSETTAGQRHGFIWSGGGGAAVDIGTLGGTISLAYSVNAGGVVAGYSTLASKAYAASIYSRGALTALGALAGDHADARGINDAGDVVGETDHAFLFHGGVLVDLGVLPGGNESSAYAINNAGQIVGYSYNGSGVFHAFVTTAGGPMTDLGTLGGSYSRADAINDAGVIVGQAYVAGDAGAHAFVYRAGVMTDLDTLGSVTSEATGVNAAGTVVGTFETISPDGVAAPLVSHAFIAGDGGPMVDLNTLIPADSGWVLEYAGGINDAGQIAGSGTVQGHERAFRLDPM